MSRQASLLQFPHACVILLTITHLNNLSTIGGVISCMSWLVCASSIIIMYLLVTIQHMWARNEDIMFWLWIVFYPLWVWSGQSWIFPTWSSALLASTLSRTCQYQYISLRSINFFICLTHPTSNKGWNHSMSLEPLLSNYHALLLSQYSYAQLFFYHSVLPLFYQM